MKPAFLLLMAIVVIASCRKEKEDNRAYSNWYVNGEKFSSRNTHYSTNLKNVWTLDCLDEDSQGNELFGFMIVNGITRMSSYPKLGLSSCSFSYHNKLYVPPYDTCFYIRGVGTQIIIDSAWVYQLNNDTHQKLDSALVRGTFSQP